ncbi:prepilin-type cleavage/methylation domain-containing protein [Fibrobacter sp. UWB4]|uniref:pilus assembly FimT family protein n=1 Tax=Fibrobacter sp. UWB4 TaxID=1964356 RepID=UPI000B523DED|nr:prepilin-type N-terminal cleavage/methylation domain-containing protein [Fibrobacter sp. UWB4]OWV15779.1 prepilin-type cleavage/methylation domain-containing protein [Fibrobacter sp. UWB4]
MLNYGSKKNGYTLIEVLVVVSIMGILSSMGVVSLRGAVVNSRMKDNALNTTAFLERIANEANRMSKTLCVKKISPHGLGVYVTDDCSSLPENTYDTFYIDAPAVFGCDNQIQFSVFEGSDWAGGDGVIFQPRIGLSAAPSTGYICMQYGDDDVYAVAAKYKNKNMIVPMWRSGTYWDEL